MIEIALSKIRNNKIKDQQLLKQIAKGNQEAFAVLYQRHSKKIFGYAFHILKNQQSAEDVLQETFLAIWQKAKTFRGEGRVIAWLFGIAHNISLKVYNQKQSETIQESFPTEENIEAQITKKMLSEQNKQLLIQAIQQLSIKHQTILQLVFYEKMSMKEVAQICQIPIGTVKSRLNYAKQALKGNIRREGFNPEELYE